ncbi:MAG: tyrosine recombinase XerD [Firmicutes bacterium]|nr:tyrosine recombinase XerD [Bacillota bacterium]
MYINDFEKFLIREKQASDNTVNAYMKDLEHFEDFVVSRGIDRITDVSNSDIVAYLMELKKQGRSKSTVNRRLTSIRTFYKFLLREGKVRENPAEDIKSPRIEKKDIEFLSIDEVNKLMTLPDESIKGIRDRAILELMYATGIRASELIDMKLDDLNMRMGFVKCTGEHSKARIIPIGRPARHALEDYVYDARPVLLKNSTNEKLFVNYAGESMTRQGLWKILKEYGEEAGLKIRLTPQVLRNSFAVHMLQNGADIKSIQELMGHEDIAATQAYLAVTKNRIKDVYDRAHPRA